MALAVTPILATEIPTGGPSLASGVLNRGLKEIQDYLNASLDLSSATFRALGSGPNAIGGATDSSRGMKILG